MTHESFMSEMLRPTYVWRMASALIAGRRSDRPAGRMDKSARTRARNARVEIDDLVLERAREIELERA